MEEGPDPVVIYAHNCSTTRTIERKTLSIELHLIYTTCPAEDRGKLSILQSRTSVNYSYKEIKPGHSPDLKKNSHRLVVCPKTLWSLATETTKASVTGFICCFPQI